MLRIHFSSDDIARTRVAPGPDPLWEVVLSLHLLRNRQGALVFDDWRRAVRTQLTGQLPMLRALNPPRGYFPDFLTPVEAAQGLDAGIEAMLRTPRSRLRTELLRVLSTGHELPHWAAGLASGAPDLLRRLEAEIRAYQRHAIAPYWSDIEGRIQIDRARRAMASLNHGAEGLLNSLGPVLRWHPPVLEADYPGERDIWLGGRGLLLVPSYFCWRRPVTLADDSLTPVVVYPIDHEPEPPGRQAVGPQETGRQETGRHLEHLLGPTRAAVLASVPVSVDNADLARRVGIAPSSASEHVAVLRDAGLVMSERVRRHVRHRLTPLGVALVKGHAGTAPPTPAGAPMRAPRTRTPRTS